MKLILRSCRIEVEGLDRFISIAQRSPCILMLWHNRLIALSELLYRHAPDFLYHAVVSKSRDGDSVALLANSYRAGRAIRVAHNARHRALNQIITLLKEPRQIILITPDGPERAKISSETGDCVCC